jgi:predicted XRE-type DNA-binding protein
MMNVTDLSSFRKGRQKLALAKMRGHHTKKSSAANVEHWIETIEEFIGRKDAKFCSDAHRAAATRRKDERGPSELSCKLMSAAQADDLYVGSIGFPDAAKHKRARNAALHVALAAIEVALVVHKSTEAQEPVVAPVDVAQEQEPVVAPVDVAHVVEAQDPNANRTEAQEPVVAPVDVADVVEAQEPVVAASTSEDVRAKLASFMKQTKMTQSQVGKAVQLSQAQVSRFLGGKIVLLSRDCDAIEKMINERNN